MPRIFFHGISEWSVFFRNRLRNLPCGQRTCVELDALHLRIHRQVRAEHIRRGEEGDAHDLAIIQREAGKQIVQNGLLVHDPAENDVLNRGAAQKVRKRVGDVVHDHSSDFVRDEEGVHIPAPVAVQIGTGGQQALELLAGGSLAHAHRPADEIEALHAVASGSSGSRKQR